MLLLGVRAVSDVLALHAHVLNRVVFNFGTSWNENSVQDSALRFAGAERCLARTRQRSGSGIRMATIFSGFLLSCARCG